MLDIEYTHRKSVLLPRLGLIQVLRARDRRLGAIDTHNCKIERFELQRQIFYTFYKIKTSLKFSVCDLIVSSCTWL